MKTLKRHSLSIAALTSVFAVLILISLPGSIKKVAASRTPLLSTGANVTVFATGLNNPRGLKFGPDGNLYVAEGGTGGSNSTAGPPPICLQVPIPVGPYTGSATGGRISKIDQNGVRTTVVDNLPSSKTGPAVGSAISGVADVAFIGDTLYALLSGAGCSHGVPSLNNGIVRINSDGTHTLIADLSAFQQANPVENPEPDDFEPDGTWYSMVVVRGDFYAVEPNHGEVDKITPDGQITRVVDISASQGHIVPTAIAYKGNFFVGNLGTFPIVPGSEQIRKLTPSGQHQTWTTGLTTVLGLAFDNRDRLYVLESMTNPGFPGPGQLNSGKVVRIDPSGAQTVIATGLSFPTGMTFGPDGALYVSNFGLGVPPVGLGQIVRIELPHKPNALAAEETTRQAPPPTIVQQPASQQSFVINGQLIQQSGTANSMAPDDVTMQQVAAEKLSEDLDLASVCVTVNDAQGVLTGTVNSAAAKAKAEKLVKSIRGVKSIENKIVVSGQ